MVPFYKWSVFISNEIAIDEHGNITSGFFAGLIKGEQHEIDQRIS